MQLFDLPCANSTCAASQHTWGSPHPQTAKGLAVLGYRGRVRVVVRKPAGRDTFRMSDASIPSMFSEYLTCQACSKT